MTDKTKTDLNRAWPNEAEGTVSSNRASDVVTADDVIAPAPPARKLFGLSLSHWLFLYGLFIATVITWVASQGITQFKHHGQVAFQDGFPGDLTQWTRRGGWENIVFEQDGIKVSRDIDKTSIAVRTFTLAPSKNRAQEKIKVTGFVDTVKKKPATERSNGGALMVWLQDDSDKVVNYLNVGKLDGLSDHYELTRVVNLTDNITRFSLALTNKKTSAEFALVDASVSLVTELPMFRYARVAIFLTWFVLLLITLYYLFTHASRAMFAVIATVITLTITGVIMPETIRSGIIQPIYETVRNVAGLTNDEGLVYAYKVGHFIFFFLSTFILLLYREPLKLLVWEIYLLVILFAIATEGLQLYLTDRSTRITDLLIDFSAILAGAILAALIVVISAIRSNKSKNPPTIAL